jgi:hypothetical protein
MSKRVGGVGVLGKSLWVAGALGAFALFGARPGWAATIVVLQTGNQPPQTIYADGKHLRMESPGEKESVAILDAESGKLVVLDDKEKSYTEITEADMKHMAEQLGAARAQIEQSLDKLSPAERKQAEKALGAMAQDQKGKKWEWKFQALGQKKTVNGMPCEMYKVTLDGKPHEQDCILPWSSNLLKKSDFTGLESFGRSLNQAFGAPGGQGIPLFNEFPGLPISRVPADGDEPEQVKSVRQGSAPAGAFSIPQGYTKKPLPIDGPTSASH